MIELTRLRHGEPFLLNPDFIERVDSHVDTVVRLTTGSEYLVAESSEEILHRIVQYRSSILAALPPVVSGDAADEANRRLAAIDATGSTAGEIILDRIER